MKKEEDQGSASKPISLAPLKFDDALAGLLKVKPPTKEATATKPKRRKFAKKPKAA